MWDTILRGEVWHGELINQRKDGSLYPEEMTITPVRATGGEITHFIAVKQDITGRRRAEEALRKLNEELEQRVAERTAKVGEQSRFLEAFFHYSLDSVVFWTTVQFHPRHEVYARRANARRKISSVTTISSSIRAQRTRLFSKRSCGRKLLTWPCQAVCFSRSSGMGVTYWDWTLVPVLDKQDEVDFLVFSLRDVSQRQRRTEVQAASLYTRSLIETSLDPLVTISQDGKITDANHATELATGCRAAPDRQ